MRVLLAEDDELLGSGLKSGLQQQGWQVDWVRDGIAAEREMALAQHQAVVLDLGLPRQDGIQTLQTVRSRGIATPVLILTARDALDDRIAGLDTGADDYLVKPVDLLELSARLRALVRRAHGVSQAQLSVGEVRLDPATRQVWWQDCPIDLSAREFELLQIFMLSAGRVLSREQLETQLYEWGHEVASNTVEVHIYNLRRKFWPGLINTLRGVGYSMSRTPVSEEAS